MDFTCSIRQATPDDVEVILEMIKELAAHEDMLHECKKLTPEQFREDGFGEEPFFRCLLAEAKLATGEIKAAGYAMYYFTYATYKGRSVYLQDLYVREQYRKHGIGGNLMKTVAKRAIEKGCAQYRWICLRSNSLAYEFYKSTGACDITDTEDWHLMHLDKEKIHTFAAKLEG